MSKTKKLYPWVLACASLGTLAPACAQKPPAEPPQVSVTVLGRTPKGALSRKNVPAKPSIVAGSAEDLARRYQVPVSESQPSQGPSDALVTIVNWCDFTSTVCHEADAPMKAVMKQYKGRVRWVFRHLPSKQEDFPRHLFAQAAYRSGEKFWDARERLLKLPQGAAFDAGAIEPMAKSLGIDADALTRDLERYATHVGADIRFAEQFGVTRPFGIFVNGRRVPPSVAPAELEDTLTKLVDEELVTAEKLVQKGTPKANVYAAITEDGYWGINDDPKARAAALAEADKAAGNAGTSGSRSASASTPKVEKPLLQAKETAAQKP